MKTLLLSVWPQYADMIFSGAKTVELRRVRPRVSPGDRVLIYETSPVMALSGGFEVADVISLKPTTLWRKVGPASGLTKAAFRQYYRGSGRGHAILVRKPHRCQEPIPLGKLRQMIPGFVAPQGYRYLSANDLNHCLQVLASRCRGRI